MIYLFIDGARNMWRSSRPPTKKEFITDLLGANGMTIMQRFGREESCYLNVYCFIGILSGLCSTKLPLVKQRLQGLTKKFSVGGRFVVFNILQQLLKLVQPGHQCKLWLHSNAGGFYGKTHEESSPLGKISLGRPHHAYIREE